MDTKDFKMNKIKATFISDLHSQHRDVYISKCDLLCIAGDLTYRGELDVLRDLNQWCGELKQEGKVKEVVIIAGNHDLTTCPKKPEYNPSIKESFFTNCHYLENSSIELMGLKLYGSPASAFFHNWGWNYHRGEEIQAVWDLMLQNHLEKKIDVILTHGPCFKILDWVEREDWIFDHSGGRIKKKKEHVGDKDLLKVVKQIQPTLFCSGHIHCAYGTIQKENTLFVNASTCTEEYNPVNPPIVVDFEQVDGKWKAKIVNPS
jgi:Icc-related predicted phosphoesterase